MTGDEIVHADTTRITTDATARVQSNSLADHFMKGSVSNAIHIELSAQHGRLAWPHELGGANLMAHQDHRRPLSGFLRFVSNCSRRIGVTLPVPLHSGQSGVRPGSRPGTRPPLVAKMFSVQVSEYMHHINTDYGPQRGHLMSPTSTQTTTPFPLKL